MAEPVTEALPAERDAAPVQTFAENLGQPRHRGIITGCTILASVMFALDGTIANVALPYMQGSMAASQDQINWVLTSYIVATAIMTGPIGFFAARFGRARLFFYSIIGFTLASILCGAAQSLDQMVFFRILQGLCGAPMVPLSQAVLFDIYPPARRGVAMSMWAVGVNMGPILGPTLGGWLTQDYSWRWVFYINVPFGIVTAFGLLFFLKDTVAASAQKLDWIGFIALSFAVGGLQLVLDRGETLDWLSSPEIIIEAVAAVTGFYIFLVQSALAPKPFLSPRLFFDGNFVAGTILYFTVGMNLYATLALLAPYLQEMMNYPVITTGIVLGPRGAGTLVAAVIAGRLVRVTGPRPLIFIGLAITAYGVSEMMRWTPDVSPWTIASTSFIQGLGVSAVTIPLTIASFATLAPSLRTEATGVYNLLRNIGSAAGISITGALLVRNTQVNHAIISGVVDPFNRALHSPVIARFWNPDLPAGAALLNAQITRQASIIAYNDDFRLMLWFTLAVVPLVLMIRTPRND